ncbi:hypothetical protein [Micromonospora sp. NPDC007230]|uniref:hypothetical protein n=1 Tax=Micromonospora sp. NPDC007230 TaxID=3364237 RepID=UPI00367D5027
MHDQRRGLHHRLNPSPGAAITSSPWIVVGIGAIVMVLLVVALTSVGSRRTYPDRPVRPVAAVPLPEPAPGTLTPTVTAVAPVTGMEPVATTRPDGCTANGARCAGF